MTDSIHLHPLDRSHLLRNCRICLSIFMAGLVLSGITAFPLRLELTYLVRHLPQHPTICATVPSLVTWFGTVLAALDNTANTAPFLAYGTDWLAFAHLVIAMAFIGPFRDPVRNTWVVTFGLLSCIAVIPLALVAGPIRGIPLFWRLVDCSFGIIGAMPLLLCRYYLRLIEFLDRNTPGDRRRRRAA